MTQRDWAWLDRKKLFQVKHKQIKQTKGTCVFSRFSHVWLFATLDCSPPGSLPMGFSRQEDWSCMPITGCHFLLRGSYWPRDQTQVFLRCRRIFYCWATREDPWYLLGAHSNIYNLYEGVIWIVSRARWCLTQKMFSAHSEDRNQYMFPPNRMKNLI